MLADVQVSYKYLHIFLEQNVTFPKITSHVRTCFAGQVQDKLKAIETSIENLTEIKVRFAQISEGLKGIVPRVLHFMAQGW